MTAKHTHQVVFGRREAGCPRCAELAAGAAPVKWRGQRTAELNRQHSIELCQHFRSVKHLSGGCGPVCTFGEW